MTSNVQQSLRRYHTKINQWPQGNDQTDIDVTNHYLRLVDSPSQTAHSVNQVFAGSILQFGPILSLRLIRKYLLLSFSPSRWFLEVSCQLLSNKCALSTRNRLSGLSLPAKRIDRFTVRPEMTITIYREYFLTTQEHWSLK